MHEAVPGLRPPARSGRGLVRVDHDRLGPAPAAVSSAARVGVVLLALEVRVGPVTEDSGIRAPAGESPGSSTSRPRRNRQRGLAQPLPHQAGRERQRPGRGCRLGVERGDQVRVGPSGSSGRGRGPSGLPTSAASAASGSSKQAAAPRPAARSRAVTRRAICSAAGRRVLVRLRRPSNGSASSAGSVHSGSPSAPPDQADLPARQRLAGVPLALAALDQPARGEVVGQAGRRARWPAPASPAPSAATVHCGEVMSSMETKVGSPPMVRSRPRRRSGSCRRAADRVQVRAPAPPCTAW